MKSGDIHCGVLATRTPRTLPSTSARKLLLRRTNRADFADMRFESIGDRISEVGMPSFVDTGHWAERFILATTVPVDAPHSQGLILLESNESVPTSSIGRFLARKQPWISESRALQRRPDGVEASPGTRNPLVASTTPLQSRSIRVTMPLAAPNQLSFASTRAECDELEPRAVPSHRIRAHQGWVLQEARWVQLIPAGPIML